VVEEDGMSDHIAECGAEATIGGYVVPVIPAEGRQLCKRCVRTTA
jgi:hypothetical protein